jgi:hypothetical protein
MKTLKTLGLSLVAAAISAGAASAATTIHIVGSSAFRSCDTAAAIYFLNAKGGTLHAAYDNASTSLLGANGSILANGTIGSGGTATFIIECYWTGSLAGTVDVASQSATDIFLDPSSLPSGDVTTFNSSTVTLASPTNSTVFGGGSKLATLVSGGTTSTPPSGTIFAAPDLAFSDSVSTTIASELGTADGYVSPVGNTSSLSQLVNEISGSSTTIANAGNPANATKHNLVGIVPFVWAIGNVTASSTVKGYTSIGNITQQAAEALIANGSIPQSFLTGGSGTADIGNYFYLLGRNEDSGTRIAALSESQAGVTNAPIQNEVTVSGSVTGAFQWPGSSALNTEPNISWSAVGHSGYATGSQLAAALNAAEDGTETGGSLFTDGNAAGGNTGSSFFIGYLGVTDAVKVTAGTTLQYNGVTYSPAAVENGQYTFWSYEHAYRQKATSETAAESAADSIADDVYLITSDVASDGTHTSTLNGSTASTTLAPGIPYQLMKYTRSTTEGGAITP